MVGRAASSFFACVGLWRRRSIGDAPCGLWRQAILGQPRALSAGWRLEDGGELPLHSVGRSAPDRGSAATAAAELEFKLERLSQ